MRVLKVVPKSKGTSDILLPCRNTITSSNGADGIIEYMAAKMNVAPGYCDDTARGWMRLPRSD